MDYVNQPTHYSEVHYISEEDQYSAHSLRSQYMKAWLKTLFEELSASPTVDEAIIAKYFSPKYVQHVDGHTLNYSEFVQHMKSQKAFVESAKVTFEHCIVEGNAISTVHYADVTKKDGSKVVIKVIAYFEVEDGKLVLCDELTHMVKGAKEDREIGSMK